MKTLRNIMAMALVAVLSMATVALAETARLGASRITFNPAASVTKTADYTLTASDSEVKFDATAAARTGTLPSVTSCLTGQRCSFRIEKTDSSVNVVTISPATGDTIGGESARKINTQNAYAIIHAGPGRDWTVEFESAYVVEDHEAGTVVFDGLNTFTADVTLTGTTPALTVGDSGDEDTYIIIDGQSTDDFYIAFDTADDDLNIGYGGATEAAAGTQTAIEITDSATPAVTIPNNLTVNGDTAIGNAATDDLTITSAILGATPFYLDGTTDDTNELIIGVLDDPSADKTVKIPSKTDATVMISSLVTNDIDVANSVWAVSNGLAFGGATGGDGFEIKLQPSDPGADYTLTVPAATGTLKTTAGVGSYDVYSLVTTTQTLTTADCGKTYATATDNMVFNLPATAGGCRFTFINAGAAGNNNLKIDPDAADQIFGTITLAASVVVIEDTAGDAMELTKGTSIRGDAITLVGDGADGWYIVSSTGIWAEL